MICEVRSAANVRFVTSGRELLRHRSVELQAKVCDGDVAVHPECNWAGFVRGAIFSVVVAADGDRMIFVFPSVSSQVRDHSFTRFSRLFCVCACASVTLSTEHSSDQKCLYGSSYVFSNCTYHSRLNTTSPSLKYVHCVVFHSFSLNTC